MEKTVSYIGSHLKMHSSYICSLILAAICLLRANVNGDCCTSYLDLTYKVKDASCGAVGGHGSSDRCSITICANGAGLVGTWCGQGPCNPFGCNCDGGCLKGDWSKTFLKRNKKHTIEILEEKWGTVDLSTVAKDLSNQLLTLISAKSKNNKNVKL